jgi:diadenosine tetraphosphatase ApaH/serine/threonine PP2A family protein phosphatase
VPLYFRLEPSGLCDRIFPEPEPGHDLLELTQDMRYIVNPGSVGQPRNQDPRACYAILDLEARTIRFHRVAYDIPQTQEQMRAVQLPIALIHRLEYGI